MCGRLAIEVRARTDIQLGAEILVISDAVGSCSIGLSAFDAAVDDVDGLAKSRLSSICHIRAARSPVAHHHVVARRLRR